MLLVVHGTLRSTEFNFALNKCINSDDFKFTHAQALIA